MGQRDGKGWAAWVPEKTGFGDGPDYGGRAAPAALSALVIVPLAGPGALRRRPAGIPWCPDHRGHLRGHLHCHLQGYL